MSTGRSSFSGDASGDQDWSDQEGREEERREPEGRTLLDMRGRGELKGSVKNLKRTRNEILAKAPHAEEALRLKATISGLARPVDDARRLLIAAQANFDAYTRLDADFKRAVSELIQHIDARLQAYQRTSALVDHFNQLIATNAQARRICRSEIEEAKAEKPDRVRREISAKYNDQLQALEEKIKALESQLASLTRTAIFTGAKETAASVKDTLKEGVGSLIDAGKEKFGRWMGKKGSGEGRIYVAQPVPESEPEPVAESDHVRAEIEALKLTYNPLVAQRDELRLQISREIESAISTETPGELAWKQAREAEIQRLDEAVESSRQETLESSQYTDWSKLGVDQSSRKQMLMLLQKERDALNTYGLKSEEAYSNAWGFVGLNSSPNLKTYLSDDRTAELETNAVRSAAVIIGYEGVKNPEESVALVRDLGEKNARFAGLSAQQAAALTAQSALEDSADSNSDDIIAGFVGSKTRFYREVRELSLQLFAFRNECVAKYPESADRFLPVVVPEDLRQVETRDRKFIEKYDPSPSLESIKTLCASLLAAHFTAIEVRTTAQREAAEAQYRERQAAAALAATAAMAARALTGSDNESASSSRGRKGSDEERRPQLSVWRKILNFIVLCLTCCLLRKHAAAVSPAEKAPPLHAGAFGSPSGQGQGQMSPRPDQLPHETSL